MVKKILLALAALLTALAGGMVAENSILGNAQPSTVVLLDAAVNAATIPKVLNVHDASDVVCAVDWATNPSSTIKFVGSLQDTSQPDFYAAQTSTNQYEFLDVTDMQSGSSIDGDTGLTASTTADNRMVKIETRYIKYFSVRMITTTFQTSMSPVTVRCLPSNVR